MESDYSSDADTWLDWAEATYAGAQTLFLSDNALVWFPAALLGHQALEMFLKAALIREGHRIVKSDVWGHDLCGLARELQHHGVTQDSEFMQKLQIFTDFFNELRYPASLKKVEGLGQHHGLLLGVLVKILRPYTAKMEGDPNPEG
jgi:HEPN domain-containing protein